MRGLWIPVTLLGALALAACSDAPKESKGEKGDPGSPGPKGDPGVAGTTLRVVAPQSSTASCQTDEIMISAYCTAPSPTIRWFLLPTAHDVAPTPIRPRCG